jgi:hypothetical protein
MIANRTARYSMFALLNSPRGCSQLLYCIKWSISLSVGRSIADVGLDGTIA